jgi:branched-chain amino acid transport system permease protein
MKSTLLRHLGAALLIGLALYLVSISISPYHNLQLATGAYYFAALAGLTLLTGLGGQISIGHGALMAIGAYATALLIGRASFSLVEALVAATVITGAFGVVFGAGAARLRGPYLAGATLALAVGLPSLADRYPGAFGGANGLTVSPPTPPLSLGETFPLERWQAWIACLAALIVFVLLANLIRGRTGRVLRAVRDDEISAQLCGIPVERTHVIAFTISAACAGLGGALYVVVNSLAAPGAFDLALSLSLLTGVVLGGLGSLNGAVWGALLLVLLPQWSDDLSGAVSASTDVKNNLPLALYGIALIVVMSVAPRGIQGALRDLAAAARHRGIGLKRRRGANGPYERSTPREEGI